MESRNTILEEDYYPGLVLASSSPSNQSSGILKSIPHARADKQNFSLGGEGMQLRDPNFKVVNQERAANFILEQIRNEVKHPFPYAPGVNATSGSTQLGDER